VRVLVLFLPAANYNRPKPVDPLWYRADCWLVIRCENCNHAIKERVRDFQTRHLLPGDMRFFRLADLLKCARCGRKRPKIEVTR
jgi:DNA-directed RNA polymerase subunit RPC12/RpoP